jgi:hypothetical protein
MRWLLSSFLLLTACASSFRAEQEARALAISAAEAIEGSDCASMAARLDAALAPQSARIESLANAGTPATVGGPDAGDQRRLLRMARRAKDCAATNPDPAAARALAPLARLAQRPPRADDAGYDCADDCCVRGWQAWAEVTYFSGACLGGDERACCMAVTIASYDACMGLYCRANECCTATAADRAAPARDGS